MAKAPTLSNADLSTIEDAANVLVDLMRDAADRINKQRVDKLDKLADRASTCAVLAREASNLGVFLMMQDRMQAQRAEIERMRANLKD